MLSPSSSLSLSLSLPLESEASATLDALLEALLATVTPSDAPDVGLHDPGITTEEICTLLGEEPLREAIALELLKTSRKGIEGTDADVRTRV